METVDLNTIQKPLRRKYVTSPESAMVVDQANTYGIDAKDPFHFKVKPMADSDVEIPVGVHYAVGGLHDAPTPGDILCAALAACQDSSIRMVANLLGVELKHLEVKVTGNVDVRGTLAVDTSVPVGFQSMNCSANLKAKPGTSEKLLKKLEYAAQRCYVVQQTLNNPPKVKSEFVIEQ